MNQQQLLKVNKTTHFFTVQSLSFSSNSTNTIPEKAKQYTKQFCVVGKWHNHTAP